MSSVKASRSSFRRAFLAVLAVTLFQQARAADDAGVRIVAKSVGGTTALHIEIRGGMDVTLRLTADLENMESSRPLPLDLSWSGRTSAPLVEFVRSVPEYPANYSYQVVWQYGVPGGHHDPAAVYQLPYPAGRHFPLTQGNFGKFSHGPGSQQEHAFDFTMPVGSVVCAAREGVVAGVRSDSNAGGAKPRFKRATNYVVIRHADGTYAEYLHLRHHGVSVKVGDRVTGGQPIGFSGNTGYSTHPHLHLCVFRVLDGAHRETIPVNFVRDGRALVMREGGVY